MIIGIGTDIAQSCRISELLDRFGESFFRHVYSSAEAAAAVGKPVAYHAGRWAAKEAAAKALGCGFGAECHPAEIIISNAPDGRPQVEFVGVTGERFARLGAVAHLSISHEKDYATAVVILEKREK